jgi:membrane protein
MFGSQKIKQVYHHLYQLLCLSSEALLFELSGYIAYASLLAFFPFLIFLVALANALSTPETLEHLIQQIYQTTPQEIAQTIVPIIQEVTTFSHSTVLTISLLGMLWIASSGVEALRVGLNRAYRCQETRHYLHCKIISFGYVVLFAVAVIIVLGTSVVLPLADQFYKFQLGMVGSLIQYGLGGSILSLILSFIYSHLPCRKLLLRKQLLGACFAAFSWLFVAETFSSYIHYFTRYSVIYGSLSGVVITLFFFQLSAYLILLGAQINGFRYFSKVA